MAAISDDKLQEIKERVDIVDLVGRYVGLRRSGKNYSACCPFHEEKTPSFYVNPERRSYKCFGCGVYGDGIAFVMNVEGKGFVEACRKLAELYGVLLPNSPGREKAAEQQEERDVAYAVVKAATEIFRETLLRSPEGEAGRAYQQERGLDPEISETFRLGYAPAPSEGGWDFLARRLAERKLDLAVAEKLGLVGRSERTGSFYDRFRGRLIFPIIQPGGSVIGFSGRILPIHAEDSGADREAPKYINSSESVLYSKSQTLFGLHTASPAIRQRGRAILVEGNVDVVSMHQKGFNETVAPLGTALTAPQLRILSRFTDTVLLCFDGDRAGRKAAREAIPLVLDADMDARIVVLGDGLDPDTVDGERLAGLFDRPTAALEWLMLWMVEKGASESPELQIRALDALAPLLRKVRREAARDLYIDLASKLLKIPRGRISSAVRGGRPDHRRPPHPTPPMYEAAAPIAPLPRGQSELVMLLVDNPQLAVPAVDAGALEALTDPRLQTLGQAVVDAALRGESPGEGELLELVDPREHRQIHDRVFSGTYRDTDADIDAILHELLTAARRERLKAAKLENDRAMAEARASGDLDRLRALAQERIALRRQLEVFDLNPPNPPNTHG